MTRLFRLFLGLFAALMAITRNQTDVTFSASHTASVSAGGTQTSDTVTLDATCVAAQITLKADNSTTPAADDQIDVFLLQSSGDTDAAEPGTDEWDTVGHAIFLARLDTNAEDPAQKTVHLPLPQKSFKVYFTGVPAGTTNAITVSATITEQRAA